jgi:hypothetical protein
MLETRVLKSRSRSRQLLVSVASEENRMKLSPPSLSSRFCVSAPAMGLADGAEWPTVNLFPLPPAKDREPDNDQDSFKHATIRPSLAH